MASLQCGRLSFSIRAKLITACGGLALITGLVGAWGIWAFSSASAAFQVAVKESLPAIDHLMQIDRDMHEAVVAERSLMFMKQDTPDAQAQVKQHAANLSQIGERWKKYIAIPAGEAERRRWSAFEAARAEWEAAAREAVKVVGQDNAEARRDAIDLTMGEGTHKFAKARAILGELIDFRRAQAEQHAQIEGARAARHRWSVIASVLGAFGLAVGMGLALARMISRPLAQTVTLLRDIAEGEGDLTKRLEATRRDEIGELARCFNTFVDKLAGIIGSVRLTATQVTGASRQLSGATGHLASGTQQQAASLEESAASLEEITATVKQNADNARQASQLASGSREAAERGGQVVAAAVASMNDITQASRKIADIISVIDEIAFQTNLLALNAAVEAARAGEQGRGFAVVAAEVRNLAQRSAGAAKEIKTLIQDSVGKVQDGAALVNKSGETLNDIVQSAKRAADIVAEIAAACQEQSGGVDQVNRAVAQMDRVTQDNAAQTEELSSTAEMLAAQAAEMLAVVGRFTLPDSEPSGPLPAATFTTAAANQVAPAAGGHPRRRVSEERFRSPRTAVPRGGNQAEQLTVAGNARGSRDRYDAIEEF